MNDLSILEYFILFIAISFIFWGGYLIGINRDKLFPKEENKTIDELGLDLKEALEVEDYEEAIRITKKIKKNKK